MSNAFAHEIQVAPLQADGTVAYWAHRLSFDEATELLGLDEDAELLELWEAAETGGRKEARVLQGFIASKNENPYTARLKVLVEGYESSEWHEVYGD